MNFEKILVENRNGSEDMFELPASLSSYLEINLDSELQSLQTSTNPNMGLQIQQNLSCSKCNAAFSKLVQDQEFHCECRFSCQLNSKGYLEESKKRGRPKKIIEYINDDDKKHFICEHCAKGFKNKYQLKIHSSVHVPTKSFSCDLCGKCFKLKQQLKIHYKTHDNIKPFRCDICEKAFKLKQQLEHHSKTHSNIRPFECTICKKGFKFKQQLQIHSRVHNDLRPFECDICDKSFKLKQQLQFHERVHSNFRPFACELCDKSFKLKQQLQIHGKVHSRNDEMEIANNYNKIYPLDSIRHEVQELKICL